MSFALTASQEIELDKQRRLMDELIGPYPNHLLRDCSIHSLCALW